MLEHLLHFDEQLFLFLNGLHTYFSDTFMWLVSEKLTWIPFYAILLFVLWKNYSWRKCVIMVIGIALVITFADQMCATIIRPQCMRMRPSNTNNPLSEFVHIVNNYRGGRYGFPSCHAANTLGVATFLCLIFRNKRVCITLIVWALLNCYSRIALGVHYPGDLLVGGMIGFTGAYLLYKLMQYIIRTNFISNWLKKSDEKAIEPKWFDFIPLTLLALLIMFSFVGFLA